MTILVYATNSGKDIDLLLSKGKKNFLMSYYYLKSKSEDKLHSLFTSLVGKYEIFMLDSGAFSAWNNGTIIPLFDYLDFIKKYHVYFSHIICLDVIDNPILSEVNHLIMQQELKDYDLEIIPVFHSGEPFSVLDYMVNKNYKYLGISPNNNWQEKKKKEWLSRVFTRYDFEKLGIKTHGFGYQSTRGLSFYPLTSSDAITWRIGASYGYIMDPELPLRYSNKSIRKSDIVDDYGGPSKFVIELSEELGITIDELREDVNSRVAFNIEALDRIAQLPKTGLDVTSLHFSTFDEGSSYFSEEKVLEQLEFCLALGRKYSGNLEIALPQKRNTKRKLKNETFLF